MNKLSGGEIGEKKRRKERTIKTDWAEISRRQTKEDMWERGLNHIKVRVTVVCKNHNRSAYMLLAQS